MKSRSREGRGSQPARRIGLGALVLLSVALAAASPTVDELTDGTRDTLARWMELKGLLSKEKRDWDVGKEVLIDRIALLQDEIARLRERTSEAGSSVSEADRAAADKATENDRMKAAEAGLAETVRALEARVKDLLPRLPAPIREKVRPLSQSLPADPESTELSLSPRYQNVVGLLNLVDKFHREVSVTSEVRTLADGSSVEVTAMYLGVSYAFYVNGDDTRAGVGTSSAAGTDGWVWTPANEHAAAIRKAIAIQQGEVPAEFVRLPIRIEDL
jgi:FtsZ-binding cell division protein ZapB